MLNSRAPFERLRAANFNPDVALSRAIILQAVIDASTQDRSRIACRNKDKALEWIFTDNTHFNQICNDAYFTPSYIRKITAEFIKDSNINIFDELFYNIENVNTINSYQFEEQDKVYLN